MSMYLEFEPQSWYKNFAIKDQRVDFKEDLSAKTEPWLAVTDNGMTGYIDIIEAETLLELKELITQYENDRKEHLAYLYRKRD